MGVAASRGAEWTLKAGSEPDVEPDSYDSCCKAAGMTRPAWMQPQSELRRCTASPRTLGRGPQQKMFR